MPDPVTIQVEALDEASQAFEDIENAGTEAANAIQSGWEEAEAAGQAHQDTVTEAADAYQQAETANDEVTDSIEEGWQEAQNAASEYQNEVGEVTADTQELGQESSQIFSAMEDHWMEITAATAGAGAGIEGMARQTQEAETTVRRLENATDLTAESIRGLAQDLTDATFSFDEVVSVMETARQRGLETEEELSDFAETWDMIGDATGENAEALAEASTALEGFGISAGEEGEALSAFGYIAQETTMEIQEFLRFTERMQSEIQELGLDIDETSAMLGILEQEMGYSGRAARQEFRQAVNQADGELDQFQETLGISDEMMAEHQEQIGESSEVIRDNAEAYAETRTPLQELRASVEGLMSEYYPFIELMSGIGPLMMGIGPTIKAVAAAKGVLTGATVGATAALKAFWVAAAPVVAPIAAIIAVVAALILLWKEFDEEIKALVSTIKDKVLGALKKLGDVASDIVSVIKDTVLNVWNTIIDTLRDLGSQFYNIGADILNSIIQGIKDRIRAAIDTIKNAASSMVDAAKSVIGMSSPAEEFIDIGEGMADGIAVGIEKEERHLLEAGEMAASTPAQGATEESTGRGSGRNDRKDSPRKVEQNIEINSPEPLDEKGVREENRKMLKRAELDYQKA